MSTDADPEQQELAGNTETGPSFVRAKQKSEKE
jgi:hypothetical protein